MVLHRILLKIHVLVTNFPGFEIIKKECTMIPIFNCLLSTSIITCQKSFVDHTESFHKDTRNY